MAGVNAVEAEIATPALPEIVWVEGDKVEGARYVNSVLAAFERPPEVTTTLAVPAEPAGVEQVICVAETRTTLEHAAPPIVTVAPLTGNPVPVIVTAVPPAVYPRTGEIAETVGGATGVTIATTEPSDLWTDDGGHAARSSSKFDSHMTTT